MWPRVPPDLPCVVEVCVASAEEVAPRALVVEGEEYVGDTKVEVLISGGGNNTWAKATHAATTATHAGGMEATRSAAGIGAVAAATAAAAASALLKTSPPALGDEDT